MRRRHWDRRCSDRDPAACLRLAALRWHVSYLLLYAIARCESTLRPWVSNGISVGLMEFQPPLWSETPYWRRSRLSARYSALAAAYVIRFHGTGPWTASRPCWG